MMRAIHAAVILFGLVARGRLQDRAPVRGADALVFMDNLIGKMITKPHIATLDDTTLGKGTRAIALWHSHSARLDNTMLGKATSAIASRRTVPSRTHTVRLAAASSHLSICKASSVPAQPSLPPNVANTPCTSSTQEALRQNRSSGGNRANNERLQRSLKDEVISCCISSSRQKAIWQRGDVWQGGNGQKLCIATIERLESEFQRSQFDMYRLYGRWELIFANDDVTRSSPFFWVLRDLLSTDIGQFIQDPTTSRKIRNSPIANSIFSTLDTLGSIAWAVGGAFQTITDGKIISEVEVKNLVGSSVVTTVSEWKPLRERFLQITVKTTQAAQSSLRQVLPGFDNIKFPSGGMFEAIKPGSSTVLAEITFLSNDLRVTRHAGRVYVYRKCSDVAPEG